MKRSVAVLGHTPQFVRWAIAHPCSLRSLSEKNLPDQSFRQLRSLREFSIGRSQGRVIDGVCVHGTASSANPQQARGFFAAEILDAHGDQSVVESCCRGCPANAIESREAGLWAGCYGWLPAVPEFQFDVTQQAVESRATPDDTEPDQMVVMLDQAIEALDLGATAETLFKPTSPRWYGIWRKKQFAGQELDFLRKVFTQVASRFQAPPADLADFVAALQRCAEHGLALHAELVPPGFSDGTTWQISGYCPDCGCQSKSTGQQKCPACKRYGHPHEIRKSKVLGLRPYVLLNGVIGESKTVELLQQLESTNRD